MLFERGDRVLFIGDSITDAGCRTDPLGFGNGYFSMVRSMVLARYPGRDLTFVNRGIGGDTTRHLRDRWKADVIDEAPDWLSVKIGINDVWRMFDRDGAGAVAIDEYERLYRELVTEAVAATGCRLIVADPYIIDADDENPMRRQILAYGEVVAGIAKDFDAIHIRTQAAYDRVLQTTSSEAWAADKIHPGAAGHAVIALEYLRAIGFELGG